MCRITSASDNGTYPEFCYLASKRDELFLNFKRHPIYNQILEHVSPDIGKDYLAAILNNAHLNLTPQLWSLFLQNDKVGNPRLATYYFANSHITCSPTTLRYIKVLADISSLFDTSNIHSVSEIGIGYAGQCNILINFFHLHQYRSSSRS